MSETRKVFTTVDKCFLFIEKRYKEIFGSGFTISKPERLEFILFNDRENGDEEE